MDRNSDLWGGSIWHSMLSDWTLPHRFALIGGLITLAVTVLAGMVISSSLARNRIEAEATSTALLLDSVLGPIVQGLVLNGASGDETETLDRLLKSDQFRLRFPHVEIWLHDGRIIYSTSPGLIGKSFQPPDGLVAARAGKVSARYTDLSADEHVLRSFTKAFLEVYVPIRGHLSEEVIAIAEIHEITEPLERELETLRMHSWVAVGGASLLIMLALGVVSWASRQIDTQRAALQAQLRETSRISDQNRLLRERARRATILISEMNESKLRDLGAELHDGPAQLIGLAALRVEHVRRARSQVARDVHLTEIETLLADANLKVRNLSKGLVLPPIEGLPLCEVVSRAVRAHEQRTRTTVEAHCLDDGPKVHSAVNICVYRFIQEGLNNAFRHAGGIGQRVTCEWHEAMLFVAVSDCGASASARPEQTEGGLGLAWIRARVESLGGTMDVQSRHDGTTVSITLSTLEMR
ncbi:sensor histidine kinase [Hoeflea ulvae]|uniref:histidine kinase n=1 Tax=Hoeflea ulvae TaxID=2983764 RepID=A0ABT3YM28_9HYPH|nr:ATP-binding protein [Hoeflea ulvae]MCY0096969.1 hypothetical protein [Hoeflea ulvae]